MRGTLPSNSARSVGLSFTGELIEAFIKVMSDFETPTILHEDFNNVDEYIGRLKGWNNDISQLTPGPWLGSQSTINAGEYQYIFFSHSIKSLHKATQSQTGLKFLVPLSAKPISYLAYNVDSPIISCAPCGQQMDAVTQEQFEGASIFISYEHFHFLLENRYDSPANCPSRYDTSYFKPTALQLHQLTRSLIHIRQTFAAEHIISLDKLHWLRWFSETTVVPMLINIIANETNQTVKLRHAIFAQAVKLILGNLDSAPTVTELSQELGVTPRHLQQQFQTALNLTPKQFISRCRLNRARQQFRSIRYKRGSIADIANNLGYWHMSGFAQDFRRLFGVTPSELISLDKKLTDHEEEI